MPRVLRADSLKTGSPKTGHRVDVCVCALPLPLPRHVLCCLARQLACHAGRLTVLLDLDGTLISSFTPSRAPVLPPSMKTHLVGVGSSLNPGGVFVVERPGLGQFLQQLAAMSEVVVFTAGGEQGGCWRKGTEAGALLCVVHSGHWCVCRVAAWRQHRVGSLASC